MTEKRQETERQATSPQVRDDVMWENVSPDDGGLTLVPLDPHDETRNVQPHEALLNVDVSDSKDTDQRFDYIQPQFTLKHIIITQAVVAFLLAIVRILAPGMMAGALGISAMLLAAVISIFEPEDRRVNIAWWSLFVMYLCACVIAIATT